MGSGAALGVELDLVDDAVCGLVLDQVRLYQPVEQQTVLPRGVSEPVVATRGRDIAASDADADELTSASTAVAAATPGSTAARCPIRA
jgi:hypothetical protein